MLGTEAAGRGAWVVRDDLTLWEGDIEVARVGVSSPYGRRYDIEIVRTRVVEVACFTLDHEDRLALALTYGIANAARGWSLPTAWVHDGEDLLTAAERVMLEVCGWTIQSPRPRWTLMRWPARCDLVTNVVTARARCNQGPPGNDVDEVGWFTRQELRGILRAGHAFDAVTTATLFWWLDAGTGPR